MKNNEVKTKSLAFAKRIVHAYQYLCDEKKEYVLSNDCEELRKLLTSIKKPSVKITFLIPNS